MKDKRVIYIKKVFTMLLDEKFLSKRVKVLNIERAELILIFMIIGYTITFSYFTIVKHYAFRTNAWDVGGFAQAFWTTFKYGKVFEYNVEFYLTSSKSFFGIHFSPILYLTLPLYALYPHIESLLVIQSTILALAALPLYLLAKNVLNSRTIALTFATSYLLSPLIQGVNWFDFHLEAFLPLEYLFAIYFFKKGNYLGYFLCIISTLMTLEQMSIINLFLALSLFLISKDKVIYEIKNKTIRGKLSAILFTIILSIAWFHLASMVQSYYNPKPPIELKGAGAFTILGVDDPSHIPFYVITHPSETLDALKYDWHLKLYYLILLFSPTLYFSILFPELLLPAIPWIGVMLVSNYPPYYLPGLQYAGIVSPFIYASSIYGLKRFLSCKTNLTYTTLILKRIATLILVLNMLFFICVSPLSIFYTPGTYIWVRDYGLPEINYHHKALMKIVKAIPGESTVLTQDRIFPHLANNINAYVLPPVTARLEKIYGKIIEELKKVNYEFIIVDPLMDIDTAVLLVNEFVIEKNYSLVGFADGALLFKRGRGENLRINIPAIFYSKNLIPAGGRIAYDPTSTTGKIIAFKPMYYHRDVIWFGPYTILPPGLYKATFRIKVNGSVDGLLLTLDVVSNRGKKLLILRNVYGDEIPSNTWVNITLTFYVNSYEYYVEFRGINPTNRTEIYLDYIKLEYLGYTILGVENIVLNYKNMVFYSNKVVKDSTSKTGSVIKYCKDSGKRFFKSFPIIFKSGSYKAEFLFKVEKNIRLEDHLLDIVITDNHKEILRRPIYGLDYAINKENNGWFKIVTYFNISSKVAEVTIEGLNVNESINICLDMVSVKELKRGSVIYYAVFDARNLFTSKGIVYKNTIRHIYGEKEGVVWFGPYVVLPPGKYIVTYWIKVNKISEQCNHIIDLDVAANMGKTVVQKFSLYTQDIQSLNTWINITITVHANITLSDVEFRGIVKDKEVDISLMYIEVIGWLNKSSILTSTLHE